MEELAGTDGGGCATAGQLLATLHPIVNMMRLHLHYVGCWHAEAAAFRWSACRCLLLLLIVPSLVLKFVFFN
jgi:hypothetical protein